MCLDTVTDMNETLNIVTGNNSDAVIDLGYEKSFHNGLSDYNKRACIYLLFPLWLGNMLLPWLLMHMLLTIFLKIPHNVIEVMVVLMVLLLSLKLVQSGVHHTCGEGHDIVWIPIPFCWGGVLNLLPNFLKESQFLEEVCSERGGDLFRKGL